MREIHLGPSDPRAFGSPSVLVAALVLVSPQHATKFRRGFFFCWGGGIYVQFISLSHSLSDSAFALPHALIHG